MKETQRLTKLFVCDFHFLGSEIASSEIIPMILSETHTGSDIYRFKEALVAPIHNFLDFITRQI